ncbi:unnamed protein product [Paramecium octaurelia]|uniref:Uncharacterized protein n=1 Tax=Paramecium octaurelia TaxID=43137 RepID=A0A8S1WCN7_PAROT|nr:unnamed protein product [Paramecium octaurelia]
MFQSKMIELEEQFKCSKNHNQPILMVLLDKQLKREERLLCTICMENLEEETKMIGFKKVLKMIQENQKYKVENLQRLIKVDVDLVEQFVNELHKLKSKMILQFDELITNSTQWILSLNSIGQSESIYSFFNELDRITYSKMKNLFNQDGLISIELVMMKFELNNLENQIQLFSYLSHYQVILMSQPQRYNHSQIQVSLSLLLITRNHCHQNISLNKSISIKQYYCVLYSHNSQLLIQNFLISSYRSVHKENKLHFVNYTTKVFHLKINIAV